MFTNEISSAMLLSVTSELPKSAEELRVIRGNRLAPAFSVYQDDPDGKISADGRTFNRTIYRWNGRFYAPAK
jgi:Ca2+-binding EF-hand superfamily protein